MGSSGILGSTDDTNLSKRPCPLNALGPGSGTFNATCEVTNKIDINKYFELMRKEYDEVKKPSPRSPRSMKTKATLARSVSSGHINNNSVNSDSTTTGNTTAQLSPRKKKNLNKRISWDERSLAIYAAKNNIKHSETCFNYDLSGHIIEAGTGEEHVEEHHFSRQKSWDLSKSKVKNIDHDMEISDSESDGLSLSYSDGDFRDILNNNKVTKASSEESVSNLGERHKHHAMLQGKISSVSQQNRRHRRRYYKKGKKISVGDKNSNRDSELNKMLTEKLVIDNG